MVYFQEYKSSLLTLKSTVEGEDYEKLQYLVELERERFLFNKYDIIKFITTNKYTFLPMELCSDANTSYICDNLVLDPYFSLNPANKTTLLSIIDNQLQHSNTLFLPISLMIYVGNEINELAVDMFLNIFNQVNNLDVQSIEEIEAPNFPKDPNMINNLNMMTVYNSRLTLSFVPREMFSNLCEFDILLSSICAMFAEAIKFLEFIYIYKTDFSIRNMPLLAPLFDMFKLMSLDIKKYPLMLTEKLEPLLEDKVVYEQLKEWYSINTTVL